MTSATERNLIGWPAVFEYVMADGTRSFIPPPVDREWIDRPSSQTYTLNIFDLAAYEELARTGALYHTDHQGPRDETKDERPTS